MLYFGPWSADYGDGGHHLHECGLGLSPKRGACLFEPHELDTTFCIDDPKEPEGQALLHHIKGWTVLAFWDRSGDGRFASNSAFLSEGTHTFNGMCEMAKKNFPRQWARFPFDVTLAEGVRT